MTETYSHHYWIDSGARGTLAHLVQGVVIADEHDASTRCGIVRTGRGALHVDPVRACPRCVDVLAFEAARRVTRPAVRKGRRR